MKKKIAWITDSTCSLPKEFIEENDVYVLPINIIFGSEVYREGVDISNEDFYEKLKATNVSPTSSQPNIAEMLSLYETLKDEYEEAIAIHCSSKLSGTLRTSESIAQEAGLPMTVIDSKIGSHPLGYMLKEGIRLEKKGFSKEDIVIHLNGLADKSRLIFTPSNMDQLKKSGRVSAAESFFGNLLKIRLIIEFDGKGSLDATEKIRTESKVKARLFEKFDSAYQTGVLTVSVLHAHDLEKAFKWQQELLQKYPGLDIEITMLIPVVGTHAGYGTMGLSWVEK